MMSKRGRRSVGNDRATRPSESVDANGDRHEWPNNQEDRSAGDNSCPYVLRGSKSESTHYRTRRERRSEALQMKSGSNLRQLHKVAVPRFYVIHVCVVFDCHGKRSTI